MRADWEALFPWPPRMVEVEGEALAVVDQGQGPAVVLLHGNPTWGFFYRELVRGLSGECRVVAPDHLGMGRSAKPARGGYTLADHVRRTGKLLDRLGVGRCVLVMHDWGGAIGCGWAVTRPERVAGLVVLNSAAFPGPRLPLRIAVCRWPLLGPLLVRGLNGFVRAALFMAVRRRPLPPPVRAGYLAPYGSWSARIGVLRFVQDIPMTPEHPSWRQLLDTATGLEKLASKPVCLCWGLQDFCFTPWFLGEWRRRFPRAETHVFRHAGHWVLEDATEAALAAIHAFCRRVWREEGR